MVTSDNSLKSLRELFIEEHLDGEQTSMRKQAWVSLCIAKAAVEIAKGEKKKKADLHSEMARRFRGWAKLISSDEIGLPLTPTYVTEQMLLTKDKTNLKSLDLSTNGGRKLWDRWLKVKRDITGTDNLAVKAALSKMPGGALPSGTDIELFLTRLMYEMYLSKKKNNDAEQEAGEAVDDSGGSVAKAAGPNTFMDDGGENKVRMEKELI